MKKVIKGILILFAVAIIMTPSFDTEAKTVTKYATKTIKLKEKCSDNSKTIHKVKRNTHLTVTKQGKKWAYIEYKGQTLYTHKVWLHSKRSPKKYTARQFRRKGVIHWGGKKWTWYTQRILPGRGLHIPGRHLSKEGFVLDKDGYIVVAITWSARRKRKIVPTPFGRYGKCYDCGSGGSAWRDIYTNW